jgi:hypothetical protein
VEINVTTYGDHTFWEGLAWWQGAIPYAWTTYWGRIGHGDLGLPDLVYQGLGVFGLVGLVGLGRQLLRPTLDSPPEQRASLAFLLVAVLVAFTGLLAYISRSPTGAQGRYLFTVCAAFAILLVLGWQAWLPPRAHAALAGGVFAGMGLFATLVLALYLWPVYSPPPALAGLPNSAMVVSGNLGGLAEIQGFEVTPATAAPGDRVYLTVYWRPLAQTDRPYSVYVHLLGEEGALLAQRDTYPGLGRNPTTAWTPGRLFADRYQVLLPKTADLPTSAHWKVGLWQAETGDYAFLLDADGQPHDSGLAFGRLEIGP